MGILNILFHNTGNKSRTLRPSDQTLPDGYRGALDHELSRCTGCGTCSYVCSPGAIKLEYLPDRVIWQYQSVACTYCGRCAEYCPMDAIRLDSVPPKTVLGDPGPKLIRDQIDYQPCERCGQPIIPIPAFVLSQKTGREVEADMASLLRLCDKCRSRVTSQRLKDSLTGVHKISQR